MWKIIADARITRRYAMNHLFDGRDQLRFSARAFGPVLGYLQDHGEITVMVDDGDRHYRLTVAEVFPPTPAQPD